MGLVEVFEKILEAGEDQLIEVHLEDVSLLCLLDGSSCSCAPVLLSVGTVCPQRFHHSDPVLLRNHWVIAEHDDRKELRTESAQLGPSPDEL